MNIFKIVDTEYLKNEGYSKLPLRKTRKSAGYDFYCPIDITIAPGESTGLIFTNVKAKLDDDKFLMLVPRSSWGLKGISLVNTTGIIDSDYYGNVKTDGNIGFALKNNSDKTITIKKNDRIIQGIIVSFDVAENCNGDFIRNGGFGSTNDKLDGNKSSGNIAFAFKQMLPLIIVQVLMLFCKMVLKASISWHITFLPMYIFMFMFIVVFIMVVSNKFLTKGD